jgi:hypothetical protein
VLKAVTLKEIEQIFAITDALGISREALVIPLRTEQPGRIGLRPDGKVEVVVERDTSFNEWLGGLAERLSALMDQAAEEED